MGGGVHDSYTFQCGLVGSFTSSGIDTRQKGPTAFSVSSERHWQGGVNGIAKVPKRSEKFLPQLVYDMSYVTWGSVIL